MNHRAMRRYAIRSTTGMSPERLCAIPGGAVNNMLWNLGHAIADECNMPYTPSVLPSPLPEHYGVMFDPGTSPRQWTSPPDVEEIRLHGTRLMHRVEKDYDEGAFGGYQAYDIAQGYRLNTIEEAIAYCTLHEAMQIGINITLKRRETGQSVTP